MTIKISQLGNLTIVQGNALIPIVSNITGTFTTVKSNIDQIGQYITSGAYTYGNLIPSANVAYDIGSLARQWRHLYLSGSTIFLGNTTIKAASGSITVAPAPVILWNNIITTNNVVPGNIQVTGGRANGSGTLSATLTYQIGDGSYNIYNMTYGTDYVINPWVAGLGNLQILLTSTYLYSTLGWAGSGNVYITETSPTSATLSNVGVTTGNISTPTGNLSITGNVSTTGNITGPTISDLYANIISANTGMKGYVDAQNTSDNSAITTANVGMIGYVDRGNTIVTASITSANVGMIGYVDSRITVANAGVTTANIGMIGYVDSRITVANAGVTTANIGMKGYVDAQTYSNVQTSAFLTTNLPNYAGNIGGITVIGNLAVSGATTIVGNLTVGNVYVPALANSTGTTGQVTYNDNYVYICIGTNNWRRANLAIW